MVGARSCGDALGVQQFLVDFTQRTVHKGLVEGLVDKELMNRGLVEGLVDKELMNRRMNEARRNE